MIAVIPARCTKQIAAKLLRYGRARPALAKTEIGDALKHPLERSQQPLDVEQVEAVSQISFSGQSPVRELPFPALLTWANRALYYGINGSEWKLQKTMAATGGVFDPEMYRHFSHETVPGTNTLAVANACGRFVPLAPWNEVNLQAQTAVRE